MVLFTAAANDNFRCADIVADFDRRPSVPDLIESLVIVNAYNVNLFVNSYVVRLTLLSPVTHSSFWWNVI